MEGAAFLGEGDREGGEEALLVALCRDRMNEVDIFRRGCRE